MADQRVRYRSLAGMPGGMYWPENRSRSGGKCVAARAAINGNDLPRQALRLAHDRRRWLAESPPRVVIGWYQDLEFYSSLSAIVRCEVSRRMRPQC